MKSRDVLVALVSMGFVKCVTFVVIVVQLIFVLFSFTNQFFIVSFVPLNSDRLDKTIILRD